MSTLYIRKKGEILTTNFISEEICYHCDSKVNCKIFGLGPLLFIYEHDIFMILDLSSIKWWSSEIKFDTHQNIYMLTPVNERTYRFLDPFVTTTQCVNCVNSLRPWILFSRILARWLALDLVERNWKKWRISPIIHWIALSFWHDWRWL